MCFTVGLSKAQRFLVAMRPGETPVPIPNTTVKARAADGTALETARESRRPPENLKRAMRGAAAGRSSEKGMDPYLENCIHVKNP